MSATPFVDQSGELSAEIQLNIAEILTLKLPEGRERVIASKWMKKFLACAPKDYRHNLSLFISCLTKQMLVKPFDEAPQDLTGTWGNFDREYSMKDINAAVIRRLYKDSFTPAYQVDISKDMKEYAAFQEIPFFGAHFYYAFSTRDTVDKWNGFNKMNVPKRLVESMWREEEIESPVKGRLFPKSKPIQSSRLKIPKARPVWESTIIEEAATVAELEHSVITIPVTDKVKDLPPGLQRRMLKANKERLENQAKREQERRKKAARSARPTTRLRAMKKMSAPSIDIVASPELKTPPRTFTPSPQFVGPHAHIKRRLQALRRANPPQELIQTTRDMIVVSRKINAEAERLRREGTPNLPAVEEIHAAGVDIGNRVLRMMKKQQAVDIENAASNGINAVQNVRITMEQLNSMLSRPVMPKESLIRRLDQIKEDMAKSAVKAINISEMLSEQDDAVGTLVKINQLVKVNDNANDRMQEIQPQSRKEAEIINKTVDSNERLSGRLMNVSAELASAVDNNDPNLSSILERTNNIVDMELELHVNKEPIVNRNTQLAQILHNNNNQLLNIQRTAQDIDTQAESYFRAAAKNPIVAKYLQTSAHNDEIINLDAVDIDFGEVADDAVMEREREKNRHRRTLVQVDDNENLMNVSGGVMDVLEESIDVIEENIIPELEGKIATAKSAEERNVIKSAVENLKENVEVLNEQLILLKDSESSETLVPLNEN